MGETLESEPGRVYIESLVMRSKIRKNALAAVLFALFATSVPAEIALCVGGEGHRSLEFVSADCCPPQSEAHSASENSSASEHFDSDHTDTDGCASDCTDTRFATSTAMKVSFSSDGPDRNSTVAVNAYPVDFCTPLNLWAISSQLRPITAWSERTQVASGRMRTPILRL